MDRDPRTVRRRPDHHGAHGPARSALHGVVLGRRLPRPVFLLQWGLAAGQERALARFLASRPTLVAGEASFAFHIMHEPMLGLLTYVGVDTEAKWVLQTILHFTMILIVAVGAHHLIELPAQRWLRRTLDRRPRDAEASKVAPVETPPA
jgi:peptidoglycan/LPS O-acetylase OafA/YrhL